MPFDERGEENQEVDERKGKEGDIQKKIDATEEHSENSVTKSTVEYEQADKQIDIEVESKSQRRKLIVALTWPSLAENFLTSLMSMVDMMMVGGLGAYAISAVGLV